MSEVFSPVQVPAFQTTIKALDKAMSYKEGKCHWVKHDIFISCFQISAWSEVQQCVHMDSALPSICQGLSVCKWIL